MIIMHLPLIITSKRVHKILVDCCNETKGTCYQADRVQEIVVTDKEAIIRFKVKGRKIITSEALTEKHFLRYFGDRHSIIV